MRVVFFLYFHDFRYPLLWLTNIDSNNLYHFEILGPEGKWKTEQLNGFEIVQASSDSIPATLIAKVDTNTVQSTVQREIRLQFKGVEFIDQFGHDKKSNRPESFNFIEFQPKQIEKKIEKKSGLNGIGQLAILPATH